MFASDSLENVRSPNEEEIAHLVTDFKKRCNVLLAEISILADRVAEVKQTKNVELRSFISAVQAEAKTLESVSTSGQRSLEQRLHTLRSSNITFLEAVWLSAKRSRGITGFFKRFYWSAPSGQDTVAGVRDSRSKNSSADKKPSGVSVDVVAEGGAEWIKVSTITESRLLFELARRGWERDLNNSSSNDDDDDDDNWREKDATANHEIEEDIAILKAAEELSRASRSTRVRYHHPHIRLVLPKICRGNVKEIDDLLNDIQGLDISVETADARSPSSHTGCLMIEDVVGGMVPGNFSCLSSTVNVDCTILLAIVSDLSNTHVIKEPWLHTAAKRQIEMEEEQNLLPSVLFPVMGNHTLVCTYEAATRMQEIVNTIGTKSEMARTEALLSTSNLSHGDRLTKYARLSNHIIPPDWQLPVQVINDFDPLTAELPSIANVVSGELSDLNRSVFLFGWQKGYTTITSNRTTAKRIQTLIEESLVPGTNDMVGPDIWVCQTARSLRAKDKIRGLVSAKE